MLPRVNAIAFIPGMSLRPSWRGARLRASPDDASHRLENHEAIGSGNDSSEPENARAHAPRYGATAKRRKLITLPSAAKPAPSDSASVAPSRPARTKHSAASAAPMVCPVRRAVATMPLALPLRSGGALDIRV